MDGPVEEELQLNQIASVEINALRPGAYLFSIKKRMDINRPPALFLIKKVYCTTTVCRLEPCAEKYPSARLVQLYVGFAGAALLGSVNEANST